MSKMIQIIETEVTNEDGTVTKTRETLQEGDIVAQEGRRFQVVKNALGSLYRKSIDPMGQVGVAPPQTPEQFQAASEKFAETQLGQHAASESLMGTLAKLAIQPELEHVQMHVSSIQPLYKDLLTPTAQKALSRKVSSVIENRDEERAEGFVRVVDTTAFLAVRIENRKYREQAIEKLLEAVNYVAARGYVTGRLVELSSIPILPRFEGADESFADMCKRLATPPERYDEVVFIFPMLHRQGHEELKVLYPKLYLLEGQVPAESFEP